MSNTFDKFEKEGQEQKKVIGDLRSEAFSLNEKLGCIMKQVDQQDQYSRWNCLLIHGIAEESQENTDALTLEIFKENLIIELT